MAPQLCVWCGIIFAAIALYLEQTILWCTGAGRCSAKICSKLDGDSSGHRILYIVLRSRKDLRSKLDNIYSMNSCLQIELLVNQIESIQNPMQFVWNWLEEERRWTGGTYGAVHILCQPILGFDFSPERKKINHSYKSSCRSSQMSQVLIYSMLNLNGCSRLDGIVQNWNRRTPVTTSGVHLCMHPFNVQFNIAFCSFLRSTGCPTHYPCHSLGRWVRVSD